MTATDAVATDVPTLEKPARGAGPLSDHVDGNGIPEVPEPGRVVQVRGSTWAVADVREQALPRSPADESANPASSTWLPCSRSTRTASARS